MAKIRISATESHVLLDIELASLPPGVLKMKPEAARHLADRLNAKAAEVEAPSAGAAAPEFLRKMKEMFGG